MKANFTTVQKDTKDPILDSILSNFFKNREKANELVSNSQYIIWL